jgi:hypothetical protein
MRYFHESSVLNRESIQRHGLDSARMGAAPRIAGSARPEADGCFFTFFEEDAGFFVRMNNTGGRSTSGRWTKPLTNSGSRRTPDSATWWEPSRWIGSP